MPLLTALANLPLYTLNVTVNVHLQSVAVLQIMDRVSKFTNRIREFRHNIGPAARLANFCFHVLWRTSTRLISRASFLILKNSYGA